MNLLTLLLHYTCRVKGSRRAGAASTALIRPSGTATSAGTPKDSRAKRRPFQSGGNYAARACETSVLVIAGYQRSKVGRRSLYCFPSSSWLSRHFADLCFEDAFATQSREEQVQIFLP
jgi:hypothetical protein